MGHGALQEKRVTVIGAGVSGEGLALLAERLGARVFVSDKGVVADDVRGRLAARGIGWEDGGHTERAFEADMLVLSSGIPPSALVVEEARQRRCPVVGELDFLTPYLYGTLVGITGSNGKSTTTSLIAHMLERNGYKVSLSGNIGRALADAALQSWDYIVVELSSFQLHWSTRFSCALGVVTNLAPDHIDWHGSYEAYVGAKANIFANQREGGMAIVQGRDVSELLGRRERSSVAEFWWRNQRHEPAPLEILADGDREEVFLVRDGQMELLFSFDQLPLIGKHNVENGAMAAAALRMLGAGALSSAEGFSGFKGLPHRCQEVGRVGGILYIDDSKGTNVASTITALVSIPGDKAIILGGQGKGEEYGPLAEAVRTNACAAVVLGEEKDKIVRALREARCPVVLEAETMEDAVRQATLAVPDGGVVLLSPACTSWDMYPNYKRRGEHFQQIVLGMGR
ncbi:MAG TPA: UDP-N-acetylmuramoyl-L-alanine--D-glutamate ligase [Synergistaceae bacterium]|nr:UDP-N-acetylmuramoyl-L-alanine--D-glutamate ligase [Synergistaceae bacterium]